MFTSVALFVEISNMKFTLRNVSTLTAKEILAVLNLQTKNGV